MLLCFAMATDRTASSFDVAEDVIDLSGVSGFDSLADVVAASQDDTNWVDISLNGGDVLRLYFIASADLSADNFIF